MEYCKITLIIPLTDEENPRPDKWEWTQLIDHNSRVTVADYEFLDSREVVFACPGALLTDLEQANVVFETG